MNSIFGGLKKRTYFEAIMTQMYTYCTVCSLQPYSLCMLFHNKNVEKQSNSHNMVTLSMSVSLDIQDTYIFDVKSIPRSPVRCSVRSMF